MNGQTLGDAIVSHALEIGFDVAGIAPAEPGRHLPQYLDWLAAGYHGEQSYLARPDRLERRRDLSRILPGARSLVVVGQHYWPGPEAPAAGEPGRGRISCYAQGIDYHHLMLPTLENLLEFARRLSPQPVHGRAYVDTGPLLERDHALAAGLGFLGKNCHLIQPRAGSWLFLGLLLLDLPLEPTPASFMPTCGSCTRCLQACPTAALVAPHVLDSRRCLSYLTTALKGPIPLDLRPLLGNRIFGCDVCQQVCPWNRFARPLTFAPPSPPEVLHLIALTPAEFEQQFGLTPIGHIRRERFLRNVAVAIGNWAAPEAVPALQAALDESSSLIRSHVAWALGRIGTAKARQTLDRALHTESDPAVHEEIQLALAMD